jgi:hypothetical protein
MFMYGSILMAVTFKPAVLSRRPVLDAGQSAYGPSNKLDSAKCTDDTLPDTRDDTSADHDIFHHCALACAVAVAMLSAWTLLSGPGLAVIPVKEISALTVGHDTVSSGCE